MYAIVMTIWMLVGPAGQEVTTQISTFTPVERYDNLAACISALGSGYDGRRDYTLVWRGRSKDRDYVDLVATVHCEQRRP